MTRRPAIKSSSALAIGALALVALGGGVTPREAVAVDRENNLSSLSPCVAHAGDAHSSSCAPAGAVADEPALATLKREAN